MFVSEILDSVIEVLGRCDREKALRKIDDAVKALQDEGDWNPNIGVLDIRTFDDGSTVALPYEVETPLAVVIDGIPVFMRDEFARYHLNGDGFVDSRVVPWVWDDQGLSGSIMGIKTPGPIIATCNSPYDEGKLIRVLGYDIHGNPLRSQLEDGTFVDGLTYPLQYATGAPTTKPLGFTFRRIFTVSSIHLLSSLTNHELVTGARMQIALVSGSLPSPLGNNSFYYIRADDPKKISLHNSRTDARTNQGEITFDTFQDGSVISLTDKRKIFLKTQFESADAGVFSDYDLVSFSATSLPPPISSKETYVVKTTSPDTFRIFKDRADAESETNQINVSSSGSDVVARYLNSAHPNTRFSFSVPHNFVTGDAVVATNSNGELPSPLINGNTYYVRAIDALTVALHETREDTTTTKNAIMLTSEGSGTSALVKSIPASVSIGNSNNVTTSTPHYLNSPSGSGAVAVVTNGGVTSINVITGGSGYTGSVTCSIVGGGGYGATAQPVVVAGAVYSFNITNPGSSYTSPPTIVINPNGPGGGASASATVGPVNGIVTNIAVVHGGSGYYSAPPLVKITGGGGAGATAQATTSNGMVTGITMISGGTGYTSVPNVEIIPSGGGFVMFSSTGALPDPIVQGTVYRAEAPITSNGFTLCSTVPEPINITSLGTGQLFLIISRAFSVGFATSWRADSARYTTGDAVKLYTTGVLPVTVPPTDMVTDYYIRVLDSDYVQLYDSKGNAQNASSVSGRISATSLGTSNLYLATGNSVTPVDDSDAFGMETEGYLQEMVDVEFETNGTLPDPLTTGTTYQLHFVNENAYVYDANGDPVDILDVGDGDHSVIISREFSVDAPTSLEVPQQQFLLGDEVKVISDDTLPDPLSGNTSYYVRPLNEDTLELYAAKSEAEDTGNITGRVSYGDNGKGIHRLLQDSAPVEVARVKVIEKPTTIDYCQVYAWDEGRDTNLALLATMHPKVTESSYRKIRISKGAKWVRMKYRRRSLPIVSESDFINLDSKMAIVMMVQSQDLLLKRFADEAERYRKTAVDYLNKRNRALDGPRAATLQINADVLTRPNDVMI